MAQKPTLFEVDLESNLPDPDEIPIRERRLITQPYDLVVQSLMDQIDQKIIFLRPISERPQFQRRYVWKDDLASRLIESILLNVPIPPCFLSQNESYELDVIDGQQRLFTIYRFLENQFELTGLTVLLELNGLRFHQLAERLQRQIRTHTLRMVTITNESHPEIKFEVFERLNSNTVPLNAQELRNCVNRGQLNDLLKECVLYTPWLQILNKKSPDPRMREEELVLRFFAFHIGGIQGYRTPQKHWLNEAAKAGKRYDQNKINELGSVWRNSIDVSRLWFDREQCFRRPNPKKSGPINKALFDLVMHEVSGLSAQEATAVRDDFRKRFSELMEAEEFQDLISRAVDHTKRTKRRFEIWDECMHGLI